MNPTQSHFKSNIVYGLIVLIPMAIIFLLVAKLVEILEAYAESLGIESYVGAILAVLLTVFLLLALCFIVGALVRTRIGSWSFERIEKRLLYQIPGYHIFHNMLEGFADQKTTFPRALVQLYGPGSAVLGFVMEDHADGKMTVFVPASPTLTVGHVHIVDRQRVTLLDAGMIEIVDCITQWGVGAEKIIVANKR
jgi:uncharacterized membrane protein